MANRPRKHYTKTFNIIETMKANKHEINGYIYVTSEDEILIPQETEKELVLCGEADKFYRCVNCDSPCGIEGHYIKKEQLQETDEKGNPLTFWEGEEQPKESIEVIALKYAEANQYDLEYYDEGGFQGIEVKSFAEKLVDFFNNHAKQTMCSEDEIKPLLSFLREIKDNWDCDEDAHRYNTTCRCCNAEKTLNEWFNKHKKQ